MTEPGSFEILDGFPADVIAVSAKGKISRAAYEETLIPAVERIVQAEGKVKLFYLIGPDFAGYTAGAAWDDAKLGILHMGDFARVAVVTDIEWIRLGMKMFAPMMRSPMHLFHLDQIDEAREWLLSDHPEPESVPGVDVDHKLPTLEDKM